MVVVLGCALAACAGSARPQAAAPRPGAVLRDCPHCPEMVVVPAGSFQMGGDEAEHARESIPPEMAAHELPVHPVRIGHALAVGRFEVTRAQYAAFRREQPAVGGDGGCNVIDAAAGKWNLDPARSWRDPGFAQDDRHPVVCVSWNDANAYVAWLSQRTGHRYRLPSESEWEYFARGGTRSTRWWGEQREDTCRYANAADLSRAAVQHVPAPTPELVFQCRDGYVQTAPVGRFPPNPFGLSDVSGNAWEWTADCWNPDYTGAPSDGSARTDGDCSKHIDRGGSWVNSPKYLRSAVRHADVTTIRNDVLGLRVVRELD
jgi:formylglycine-generating enzyme required for sulfatase activity